MFTRALFATLAFSLLLTNGVSQQFDTGRGGDGYIGGTVRSADGRPLAGVEVSLYTYPAGMPQVTITSQADGSFGIRNIPPGNYDISARSGGEEVRQRVLLTRYETSLDLRFSTWHGTDQGSAGNTVSLAQLKVSAKARSLFEKASVAFSKSRYDEARKQVDKALETYPEFAEALTLRGLLHIQANQNDEGAKDLELAIKCDPNYSTAYLALGALYNNQRQFDDATRELERGVSLQPTAWQGYFEMARAYLGKGMYERALQFANKAEGLAPASFAPVHLLKAYALLPQKLYRDAARELHAFLSRQPKGESSQQAEQILAKLQAAGVDGPAEGN